MIDPTIVGVVCPGCPHGAGGVYLDDTGRPPVDEDGHELLFAAGEWTCRRCAEAMIDELGILEWPRAVVDTARRWLAGLGLA